MINGQTEETQERQLIGGDSQSLLYGQDTHLDVSFRRIEVESSHDGTGARQSVRQTEADREAKIG